MTSFHYLCIFYCLCFIKKNSVFVISLYKGLPEFVPALPTWDSLLAYLIDLSNSREILGSPIVIDFMS